MPTLKRSSRDIAAIPQIAPRVREVRRMHTRCTHASNSPVITRVASRASDNQSTRRWW